MKRAPLFIAVVAACKPDLGAPASLVTEPRLLAVQSEPAELAPGHDVKLHALIVGPDGDLDPDVAWGFCADPAPLSDDNVAADDCIYGAVSLMARGTDVQATIPAEACETFGPTPPAPQPGQPGRRPHDPDVTGGYYQPIRVLAKMGDGEQVPAVGLTRITCDLANAPIDIVQQFHAMYIANTNPVIDHVLAQPPAEAAAVEMPIALPARVAVPLRVQWTPESAETFPVFDPETRALVTQREAIRVSWFVTAGSLASERTGRTSDELDSYADNTWTTPAPGLAHLWIVVRDTRGGVTFAGYDVQIE